MLQIIARQYERTENKLHHENNMEKSLPEHRRKISKI